MIGSADHERRSSHTVFHARSLPACCGAPAPLSSSDDVGAGQRNHRHAARQRRRRDWRPPAERLGHHRQHGHPSDSNRRHRRPWRLHVQQPVPWHVRPAMHARRIRGNRASRHRAQSERHARHRHTARDRRRERDRHRQGRAGRRAANGDRRPGGHPDSATDRQPVDHRPQLARAPADPARRRGAGSEPAREREFLRRLEQHGGLHGQRHTLFEQHRQPGWLESGRGVLQLRADDRREQRHGPGGQDPGLQLRG